MVDFIAVIGLYSQCQIVSFIPNFQRKFPNFKSEKMVCFIMVNVGLTKFVQHVEYSTLQSCNIHHTMVIIQLNSDKYEVFYD